MDAKWARDQLTQFLTVVLNPDSVLGRPMALHGRTEDISIHLTRQAQVVEPILDRVLPGWRETVARSPSDPWRRHRDACLRASVLLDRGAELREKLGDDAPILDASLLHPWVWEGAQSMWRSEHYRAAVGDAGRKVNAETQRKYGTRDLSETALFVQAFSDDEPKPGRPRLSLPEDDGGKSAASVRRGIRAYAEGCFAAIRNPAAHDVLEELPEHEALEQLAAFSVLARWVDQARVLEA